MADFEIKILSASDGSWEAFQADWRAQSTEIDDAFEDYAPDALAVIGGFMSGTIPSMGGQNRTEVGALWDIETERYYACCILNLTRLPGVSGKVLRIRQLVVCPLLDAGVCDIKMYPDVVIGVFAGIVHLSSTIMAAEHIHMHLRSPEDMTYFHAFGSALSDTKIFASVQSRGSWLHISKAAEVGTPTVEE